MKHTPGPWEYEFEDRKLNCNGYIYQAGDSNPVTCDLPLDDYISAEVKEANGFLISAAPDLFAELCAYHDREWMDPHEGLPAHKAGDCPECLTWRQAYWSTPAARQRTLQTLLTALATLALIGVIGFCLLWGML